MMETLKVEHFQLALRREFLQIFKHFQNSHLMENLMKKTYVKKVWHQLQIKLKNYSHLSVELRKIIKELH